MQYQNLFTRVQAVGPTHEGVELGPQNSARDIRPFLVHLFGRLGNAQVGPFYLGTLGLISIVTGTLSINIMGFYMLASVGWDPIEFVRQLPWLALEPPSPKYGLSFPPMNEGGWWLFASGLLLVSVLSWWLRTYRRARQLGMGTHIAWAFAAAIWLFLVLGLFRPLLMGSWSEGVPYGIFPHLDWTAASRCATATCSTTPSTRCRSSSCTARRCCSRCTARPSSR